MNPFSPGKPNDENMATLIQPQSSGVRCIKPPKSLSPRSAAPLLEQPDKVEERRRGDAVVEDLHEDAAQRRLHFDRRDRSRSR